MRWGSEMLSDPPKVTEPLTEGPALLPLTQLPPCCVSIMGPECPAKERDCSPTKRDKGSYSFPDHCL